MDGGMDGWMFEFSVLEVPPDKPGNVICETTRSSDVIDCSWERGRQTHLHTPYIISLSGENLTPVYSDVKNDSNFSVPRRLLEDHAQYQVAITASNLLGASQSDPFTFCLKDITALQTPLNDTHSPITALPESPHIAHVEFVNNSRAAMLQWTSTESFQHPSLYVNLRRDEGFWEVREATQLSEDLIGVDCLQPLTQYEFQIRTCDPASSLKPPSTASSMPMLTSRKRCSKWSASVKKRSPGKIPSQLHVWRILSNQNKNEPQNVTVLWKPPPPEEYSGDVQHYKVYLVGDQKQEVICRTGLTRWTLSLPADVQALRVSVVTPYGASPPADVPLRLSGDPGPAPQVAPAAAGNGVHVSWSWSRFTSERGSTSTEDLLHFVIEWRNAAAAELEWKELTKDQNYTVVTGLTAGVRYSLSLYAVTSRGASEPSSCLFYSQELKPASGPNMSVMVHEARRVLIQWDELALEQQRGFITTYTIYLRKLDSSHKTELQVRVAASSRRQKWLDCPEGALALQMTASTLAGEGPRGRLLSSQPAAPAAGLMVALVFFITLFIAVIVNLMCCSCMRTRIKQMCVSWGPDWLVGNLPEPGNSVAIRLLGATDGGDTCAPLSPPSTALVRLFYPDQDGNDPSFLYTHSDPPLSHVSCVSQDDIYPRIHVEAAQVLLADSPLEHGGYKPQVASFTLQGEQLKEVEEEQRKTAASVEEDGCSPVFGGLLGDLLVGVEDRSSESPLGLTLSPVSGLLLPKTPGMENILNKDFLLGSNWEVDSLCVDLQHDDIISDRTGICLSQCTLGTGGYFPQRAAFSVDANH
ncbi:interleukin-23 receptor [Aulostomus maculatus]